jgi:hypothetical protein
MLLSIFPAPDACIYKTRTKKRPPPARIQINGIGIAELQEADNMEAKQTMIEMTPCSSPLPELEVPMINTMVTCLGSEHKRLNRLEMDLAIAAARLSGDPGATSANEKARQVWEEIRQDLWSHLQIEDSLVFSWGKAHQAISGPVLDTLKNERQEMHKLIAALHEPDAAADGSAFAQTMLTLARTLDSHVERYDGEVLPSILRALFHKSEKGLSDTH